MAILNSYKNLFLALFKSRNLPQSDFYNSTQMRTNDYILWYASALFSTPENLYAPLFEAFGERFELEEPAKPGMVSLAVHPCGQAQKKPAEWIKELRKEGVEEVLLLPTPLVQDKLAPHLAAAFAGTEDTYLQVKTKSATRAYLLRALFNSPNALSPEGFVELMDKQQNPEACWERVAELLEEHYRLNQGPAFAKDVIREYILNHIDDRSYDFMAANYVSEVQVECKIANVPFLLPANLKDFLYQHDFSFGGDSEHASVFLYALRPVTAEELLALASAQPFSETEIWDGCIKQGEQQAREDLPDVAEEWPGFIASMNTEELENYSFLVCRAIAVFCEENDLLNPVIPTALQDAFGPNELEQKKAQARSSMGSDQWFLTPNKEPWELYLLVELEGLEPEKLTIELHIAAENYKSALVQIEAFAKQINSPFAEAFGVGLYLLQPNVTQGKFDNAHLKALLADLKKKQFSLQAQKNFTDSFNYYTQDIELMQLPAEYSFGLLSLSVADVFGGMGSWNDMYMETDEEQEIYQRTSAELYSAMRDYYRALGSSNV